MRHTPGPWHVNYPLSFELIAENGRHICTLPKLVDGETRANSRVLGAAPDLLEAAKEVLESPAGSPDYPAIDGLRRAVEKAEGRG